MPQPAIDDRTHGGTTLLAAPSLKRRARILKAYLGRFKLTVQQYFPASARSDPQPFAEVGPELINF
jgi:hypothetical protein